MPLKHISLREIQIYLTENVREVSSTLPLGSGVVEYVFVLGLRDYGYGLAFKGCEKSRALG